MPAPNSGHSWPKIESSCGLSKHGNDPSIFIIDKQFLDSVNNYQILQADPAQHGVRSLACFNYFSLLNMCEHIFLLKISVL
jgi:hypothetical protein